MSIVNVKPFLKWAGGKTQLLEEIKTQFPFSKEEKFSYFEPFVGSGAVLFWVLRNFPNLQSATINDINQDLINTYQMIKTEINALMSLLEQYQSEYHALLENLEEKKVYYYAKRTQFNTRKLNNITQAALFIFLNKTCFNGLYRVNKKNQYNVPIGSYKKPLICDKKNLLMVHQLLQKVTILSGDFEQTLDYTTEKSIFYFDPPYKPLSTTAHFTAYTQGQFNDNEQKRLKLFCDQLNNKGYHWILSNSDVKNTPLKDEFFDDLFKDYQIKRVFAKRSINSNASKRGKLTELLITNSEILNAI